jgi:hypothetical protein
MNGAPRRRKSNLFALFNAEAGVIPFREKN